MAEDEDIVVKVDQESGGEKVAPEADPVAELKAQYEELEGERERERTEREAAQRREDNERAGRIAAEQALDAGRTEIADSRLATIDQGIAAAQTASDAAKAEIASAQEAGDWKRVADAHEKLADARADLKMLAQGKSDLEAGKAEPRREQRRAPPDPIEAFLQGRTAPTAAWLRAHPDDLRALATNSDTRRVAKISAAHSDALAEGFGLDSPEYFAHVERFLGMTKEEPKEAAKPTGNGAAKAPPRKSGPPVAPVQASGGGVSGGNKDEVRLTKGEAAAATDGTLVWNYNDPSGKGLFKKGDPIGTTEMARRKRAMSAQGLYDKTYIEN